MVENERVAFAILAKRHGARRPLEDLLRDLGPALTVGGGGFANVGNGKHDRAAGVPFAVLGAPKAERRTVGQLELRALLALPYYVLESHHVSPECKGARNVFHEIKGGIDARDLRGRCRSHLVSVLRLWKSGIIVPVNS